jgi:hypothetical protein
MVKFTVAVTAPQEKFVEYEGDYVIRDGVLAIRPAKGRAVVYSPTGWLTLEVEADEVENLGNLMNTKA